MQTVRKLVSALSVSSFQGPTVPLRAANVRAATTAAITLNTDIAAGDTLDGVLLVAGDRVLVKNQAAPAENGVYVVTSGVPTRATDSDSDAELRGANVYVASGTVNATSEWINTNAAAITIGVTGITYAPWGGLMDAGLTPNKGHAIVQTQFATGGGTWTLDVLGRASIEAPWAILLTVTQASSFPLNNTRYDVIQAMPLMSTRLTVSAGTPGISCWIDQT